MFRPILLATAIIAANAQTTVPAAAFEPDCQFFWRVNSINSIREVKNGRLSVRKGKSCLTRHVGWVNGVWTYHGLKIKNNPSMLGFKELAGLD